MWKKVYAKKMTENYKAGNLLGEKMSTISQL